MSNGETKSARQKKKKDSLKEKIIKVVLKIQATEVGPNGLNSSLRRIFDIITEHNPGFYYQRSGASAIRGKGDFKPMNKNEKGAPDFYIIFKGQYEAWELKTPTTKLSDDQMVHQRRIEGAGATYIIIRTLRQALERLALIGVISENDY